MNILVVDIAAQHGGALSVLKDFLAFVKEDRQSKQHNWKFVVSYPELNVTDDISVEIVPKGRTPWLSRMFSENRIIRQIANEFQPDIILSLQNTHIRGLSKYKQAIYIHQSIPFQNAKVFSFFKKDEYIYAIYQHIIGKFIANSVKKADKVFVQTEWMKKAVQQKTNCKEDKIFVIPINRENKELTAELTDWDNKSFIYPAFYAIYKNQELIKNAAEILKGKGLNDMAITLTIENRFECELIRETGRLSHDEVLKNMAKSTLIFPSYIETVGLPLLEAMEMGCIILAADCEYAHETLKDYPNAYYFDPFNPEDLAKLIEDVYNGHITKKSNKFKEKVKRNNWELLIDTLLKDNQNS